VETHELHQAAVTLYGPNLPATTYIIKLAAALNMSEGGMRKTWYGFRNVSGPMAVALKLLIEKAA